MGRTAVVMMNLGGPDSPEAVHPFLFNLFSDPAIIPLPALLRLPLARLVSSRRTRVARAIYARLGGGSPLLANTEAQARALEAALGPGHRCFVAMRYWHPTSAEIAREVADWEPEKIVCLPLYPQFSSTTTASSLAAWRVAAAPLGLDHSGLLGATMYFAAWDGAWQLGIDDLIAPAVYGVTLTLAYMRGVADSGDRMVDTHFVFLNSDFVLADGSLLIACSNAPSGSPPGWYALMRLASGTTTWRQIGSVPSYHFTLTATGQIWGFPPQGGAPYMATLAA